MKYKQEKQVGEKWIETKTLNLDENSANVLNEQSEASGIRYTKIEEVEEVVQKEVEDMTKKELIAFAEEEQIKIDATKSKAEIIEQLIK